MTISTIHVKSVYSSALLLCIHILFCAPVALAEPVFKAGFTAPTSEDDPFFSRVAQVMKAAADDLNIELEINYSTRSSSLYARKKGVKLMASFQPDYFLTGFWPGGAYYHIQESQSRGIRSFVIDSPIILSSDFPATEPRKEIRQWLGQMSPDYQQASYQLADILINAAKKQNLVGEDGKVHMIAISGNEGDISVIERMKGLKERTESMQDVVLEEIILAGWSDVIASRATEKLLSKYPQATVIWSASDLMAQGAAAAIEKHGKTPGKDVLVGGFDLTKKALQDIQSGRINASIGGHFLEGAWALVLLYDYHHGVDFADELGVRFQSSMQAVTAENIDDYEYLLEESNWIDIDFGQLSKVINNKRKRYDFSLPELIKTAETTN